LTEKLALDLLERDGIADRDLGDGVHADIVIPAAR